MTDKPMSLIEAAQISYEEHLAADQDALDEQHQKNVEEFLTAARKTAQVRLGSSADGLDWMYTSPDDLPDDVEEAVALLAKGRMDWLRFRVADEGDRVTFELVHQCSECSHERASEVHGLVQLGELLAAKGGTR